jgi:hypothetical protein
VSVIVRRLVVEQSHLKSIFIRSFLQECEIVIGERGTLAVPIDDERRDAHVSRLLDLLSQNCGIVAGITDVHVLPVAEPRHVNGEELGPCVRSLRILLQGGAVYAGRGAPGAYHEAHDRQCQQFV